MLYFFVLLTFLTAVFVLFRLLTKEWINANIDGAVSRQFVGVFFNVILIAFYVLVYSKFIIQYAYGVSQLSRILAIIIVAIIFDKIWRWAYGKIKKR